MRRRTGQTILLVCSLALLSVGTGAAPQSDEEILQTFRQDVRVYAALHERLERALPPLVPSEHPHVIAEARRALARAIVAERAGAKQGDIFTPPTAAVFRARIRRALHGRDVAALLEELYEEAPDAVLLTPVVNTPFPAGATYMVPPRILGALPPLPGDMEYRLVGLHLVLWDCHANLIVDYVPDALPETT